MGPDQVVGHVVGMARGVADPGDARDRGYGAHQVGQARRRAVRARPVIGVHVLADQGDLAHPLGHELLRLRHHRGDGARDLGAAGIGHHAEGAELVAALLHGEEGGHPAVAARGQVVELVLGRKLGIDHAGLPRAGEQLRQAVVALGADHHVDRGLARGDLRPFRLRHAARHHDAGVEAGALALALQLAQAPELGIDLLRRLLADVAGVEDDDVGLLHGLGG